MSGDSIYGQHFELDGISVTVVGERYGWVFYVEGHHNLGQVRSPDFRASVGVKEQS